MPKVQNVTFLSLQNGEDELKEGLSITDSVVESFSRFFLDL